MSLSELYTKLINEPICILNYDVIKLLYYIVLQNFAKSHFV